MVSQFASRYCLEQYAQATFLISTYDSAEAALESFKESMDEEEPLPELIFLDLGLDIMDGWGFLEELQKNASRHFLCRKFMYSPPLEKLKIASWHKIIPMFWGILINH